LGHQAKSSGSFTQWGGSTTVGSDLIVGDAGSGFLQVGGSGYNPNLTVLGTLVVGNTGSGSFSQFDGSVTVGGDLNMGNQIGSSGTYTMTGGSLNATNLNVGGKGKASFTQTGTASQTGGSVNVTNAVNIGTNPYGTGIYTMDKGSLTTYDLTVGSAGLTTDPVTGTLTITSLLAQINVGGNLTFNQRSQFSAPPGFKFNLTGSNVYILSNHVDLSNTTLSFANPNANDILDVEVANFELGELDLTGGATVTITGNGFSVGTLDLEGNSILYENNLPISFTTEIGSGTIYPGAPPPVPLPASAWLLLSGLAGLAVKKFMKK
jgi:hypothetical protein